MDFSYELTVVPVSDGSYLSFSDPDGNGWPVQEVKRRAPGR
jgi:hypothetical protein